MDLRGKAPSKMGRMAPLSGHLWGPFIGPFERSSNYKPSESCLFQAIYGGLQQQPHLCCVCAHLASPPKNDSQS